MAGGSSWSETGINNVIQLSGLQIENWVAMKELMTTYFKYIDQDYRDLKKILGMDPLHVTVLRCGTFRTFEETYGRKIRHMRPSLADLRDLLKEQNRN